MTPAWRSTGWLAWLRAVVGLAVVCVGAAGCASKPAPPPPPRAWEEAGRLSRQAVLLQSNGDWNAALAWWERAALQYQLLNDRTNLAVAWHNLGAVRRALGQAAEATADLERAAGLNAELGQTNAWWRNQIALLQVANDTAAPEVEAFLARLEDQPGWPTEGRLGAVLAQERARTWMEAGRLPEALAEAERAALEFGKAQDRAGAAAARVTVAKILRRLGRFREAAEMWRGVLGEFEALGDARGVAVSLAGWGGCLAEAGTDPVLAGDLLRRAEANYLGLGLAGEAGWVAEERNALGIGTLKP